MQPSPEQIAVAAHARWERRGHGHGRHDEDWVAAERDLVFGLNYRWIVRQGLRPASAEAGPVWLGKPAGGGIRRCRFCERAAPAATFGGRPLAIPARLGNSALLSWDDCEDCRSHYEDHLAPAFVEFVEPWLVENHGQNDASNAIPVPALKGLVRMGLALLPLDELDHFNDAVEWVANPDDDRDAVILDGLGMGCRVYRTPEPVPAPFASLARRVDDDQPFPYMLYFVGTGRVVLQTALPFCPKDEELEEEALAGPRLSLSMGQGWELRSSDARFLSMTASDQALARASFQGGVEASRF